MQSPHDILVQAGIVYLPFIHTWDSLSILIDQEEIQRDHTAVFKIVIQTQSECLNIDFLTNEGRYQCHCAERASFMTRTEVKHFLEIIY